MHSVWISLKKIILQLLYPIYFQIRKKFPSQTNGWIESAGTLDFSSMLTRFNWFHRLFFRNALKRIRVESEDIQKIKTAAQNGPILYMMRNWGQIEYNFFNLLFLKEKLPLAKHANLTWMGWWMPLSVLLKKWLARAYFFYTHKKLPEEIRKDQLEFHVCKNEVVFAFLNLPSILGEEIPPSHDVILSILKAAQTNQTDSLQIIPLSLIYDRRPDKAEKTLIDLLFGEKENPGRIRKTALFFKHFKKRAVASVGEPISIKNYLKKLKNISLSSQSAELRNHLHHIFFKEKQSITGPPLKTRRRMIELVLSDQLLREKLIALAFELKKPTDELYLQAEVLLEEIVADPNYRWIDFWDVLLRWVFHHFYEGLSIRSDELQKVKEVAKKHPLVLIPSHRSHVDYLLLSYIFYQENLSMPMIAAGKNLSFWPMGYIFRKSGAYFMRRSFGKDNLYTSLFKAYLRTLIREGYFQEFFIEGTRSRTGKILPPRLGLLSIFIDCFLEKSTEDLYLIPISINYEKVLEENAYIKETKGNNKTKESFWDLFKIKQYIQKKSGLIYINFSKPISLKEYLLENFNSFNLQNSLLDHQRNLTTSLAHQIVQFTEESSTVTTSALVAAVLLEKLNQKQTSQFIIEKIQILINGLGFKKIKISDAFLKNKEDSVQQVLERFTSKRIIKIEKTKKFPLYYIAPHARPNLNYYKNSLVCHFIGSAIFSHLLLRSNHSTELKKIEQDYNSLKKIFQYESIKIPNFREALNHLKFLKLIEENQLLVKTTEQISIHLFASLIRDCVEGYKLLFLEIQKHSSLIFNEKNFLESLLRKTNDLSDKKNLNYPEAYTKFIFQNAFKFLQIEKILILNKEEFEKRDKEIYSTTKNNLEKINRFMNLL